MDRCLIAPSERGIEGGRKLHLASPKENASILQERIKSEQVAPQDPNQST